jgi:hypothetical protein
LEVEDVALDVNKLLRLMLFPLLPLTQADNAGGKRSSPGAWMAGQGLLICVLGFFEKRPREE